MNQLEIQSPKRPFKHLKSHKFDKSNWYKYYASYSPEFVKNILDYLSLQQNATILDPWNGSGTTTQVAQDSGYSSIGFDINPVMVIVAKGRAIRQNEAFGLLDACREIINVALYNHNCDIRGPNLLEEWLMPTSASGFRCLERAIRSAFSKKPEYDVRDFGLLSNSEAFLYTALFSVLSDSLRPFRTSNPTWIKKPATLDARLNLNPEFVSSIFLDRVKAMINALESCNPQLNGKKSEIEVASSDSLPLQDESIDAVISSPPYCTRIDYAIATKPELALLGVSVDSEFKTIRNKMIGTPTIVEELSKIEIRSEWGITCKNFLDAVAVHKSKASQSYYLRYYLQYFEMIYRSLSEIDRVLIKKGCCVLVVQDSYYKNIHNNLPQIFSEMGLSLRWRLINRYNFTATISKVGINKKARKYRENLKPIESVLIFRK